jgi:uncharacterized protein YjbJ (UPF0337 family)
MDELIGTPRRYCRAMCGHVQNAAVRRRILDPTRSHPGCAARKENVMNKDQVEGKLQDIGGKIQEEAGKLVGNQEQQVKGLKNQVEGKTQEKYGDAKDALRDATR